MNDLIELKLITREDAECLHKLQIEAFEVVDKESDNPMCKAERGSPAIAKRKEEIVRGCGVLQR